MKKLIILVIGILAIMVAATNGLYSQDANDQSTYSSGFHKYTNDSTTVTVYNDEIRHHIDYHDNYKIMELINTPAIMQDGTIILIGVLLYAEDETMKTGSRWMVTIKKHSIECEQLKYFIIKTKEQIYYENSKNNN